jgi:hypothetical protein
MNPDNNNRQKNSIQKTKYMMIIKIIYSLGLL